VGQDYGPSARGRKDRRGRGSGGAGLRPARRGGGPRSPQSAETTQAPALGALRRVCYVESSIGVRLRTGVARSL